MTPEDRQELIHRPFPITTAYTGKIWGGVQVIDKFMRETAEDIVLAYPDGGYDGMYANAAELELLTGLDALLMGVEG